IRAEQRALRPAYDLNSSDIVSGQMCKIVNAAGLIDRNTVDQNLCVIGFTAACEQSRDAANVSRANKGYAGDVAEEIGHGFNVRCFNLRSVDDIHTCVYLTA